MSKDLPRCLEESCRKALLPKDNGKDVHPPGRKDEAQENPWTVGFSWGGGGGTSTNKPRSPR